MGRSLSTVGPPARLGRSRLRRAWAGLLGRPRSLLLPLGRAWPAGRAPACGPSQAAQAFSVCVVFLLIQCSSKIENKV